MSYRSSSKPALRRLSAAFAVGTAVAVMASGVAAADTSQASAQAAQLDLLGGTIVDTGTVSASNDGSGEVVTGDNTPGLDLLNTQTLLVAGVLAQDATAGNDGSSAACAGATGDGGTIQIGPDRDCTDTIGQTSGVVVDLNDLDLGDNLLDQGNILDLNNLLNLGGILGGNDLVSLGAITADAIYAECTATSDGTTTADATLLAANLGGLLGGTALPSDPDPDTVVDLDLAGIVDLDPLIRLVLNEQTSTGPGQVTVTALHLTVLGSVGQDPLLDLRIGTAACGPNAMTPPIPAIPVQGLPIALSGFAVAILGGVTWMTIRTRRNAGGPAAG